MFSYLQVGMSKSINLVCVANSECITGTFTMVLPLLEHY